MSGEELGDGKSGNEVVDGVVSASSTATMMGGVQSGNGNGSGSRIGAKTKTEGDDITTYVPPTPMPATTSTSTTIMVETSVSTSVVTGEGVARGYKGEWHGWVIRGLVIVWGVL